MSYPFFHLPSPRGEADGDVETWLDRIPLGGDPGNETYTRESEKRSTVFVLVKGEDDGTEDGQSKSRGTNEGEEKKGKIIRTAEQKAKEADISVLSFMDDEEVTYNERSVAMAGRLHRLRQTASSYTKHELKKQVEFLIDDVMMDEETGGHEWKLVGGTSMEGLNLVNLNSVATVGGYVSECDDNSLSGALSEDDQ